MDSASVTLAAKGDELEGIASKFFGGIFALLKNIGQDHPTQDDDECNEKNESVNIGDYNKVHQQGNGNNSNNEGNFNITYQRKRQHFSTVIGNKNTTVQFGSCNKSRMSLGDENIAGQAGTENDNETLGNRNATIQIGDRYRRGISPKGREEQLDKSCDSSKAWEWEQKIGSLRESVLGN
ncbi:uncharacterized protein F4822DRAFT_443111 [Hypoxylon trugodes]|uniref:uncharacterized protein n=1 Tax=Hypoxylon trugodes TaxID=326681 RepID=UPI002191E0AF|nr:uncharacterized protein F4822DRAFT_443111 [Hypoxylon trugodes]KAI1390111.1 hypothetical protein F4822DRAFT_443111 [Hypoxylon trugodes]